MRWFEKNLRKVLLEAGTEGLRINMIVRNICNMEPSLFGTQHPYEEAWKEIYQFLRVESSKSDSPFQYAKDPDTGVVKRGCFFFDKRKVVESLQLKLDFQW